ncbi:MAG: hypothetical protein ACUVRP_03585 [Chlorobiales bacterium]
MRKTAEIFSHLLSPSSIRSRISVQSLFAFILASEMLKEKQLVAATALPRNACL